MKLVLCLTIATLVVAAQALTDAEKAKLAAISKECREKSGVSLDVVTRSRSGEVIDDPKLKAHLFCLAQKLGMMTESGDINFEVLKAKVRKLSVSDEEADGLIKKCAVKKSTPEDTAFDTVKCVREAKPNFSLH